MKTGTYNLIKLEADEGKVFDFKNREPGGMHLYAKTIFLGDGDSADNYIEIDESEMEEDTSFNVPDESELIEEA